MNLFRRRTVADRPLSCREVGRVLQRYLDDEAPEVLAERVAEHLEDCRRCGLEVEVYDQIKEVLARRSDDAALDGAVERLRQFGRSLVEGDAPDDD